MGDMVSVLDESLSGIKVIKSYNATDYIRRKFSEFNAEFSRLMLSMARRQQLASPMSEFLGLTAVAVLIVFGGSLVMNGSLSAGGFVGFIAVFSQITRPVRSFIDQFANINQVSPQASASSTCSIPNRKSRTSPTPRRWTACTRRSNSAMYTSPTTAAGR